MSLHRSIHETHIDRDSSALDGDRASPAGVALLHCRMNHPWRIHAPVFVTAAPRMSTDLTPGPEDPRWRCSMGSCVTAHACRARMVRHGAPAMPLVRLVDAPGLLTRANTALGMTQEELGALLGVSRRTMVRWQGGRNGPPFEDWIALVRHVHPRHASLAAEIAAELGETLVSLGVEVPPAPVNAATTAPQPPARPMPRSGTSWTRSSALRPRPSRRPRRPFDPRSSRRSTGAASVGLSVDDVRGAPLRRRRRRRRRPAASRRSATVRARGLAARRSLRDDRLRVRQGLRLAHAQAARVRRGARGDRAAPAAALPGHGRQAHLPALSGALAGRTTCVERLAGLGRLRARHRTCTASSRSPGPSSRTSRAPCSASTRPRSSARSSRR